MEITFKPKRYSWGVGCLCLIFFLAHCGQPAKEDLSSVALELDIKRLDLNMLAASRQLIRDSVSDPVDIYNEYLAEDRYFYGQLTGVSFGFRGRRFSENVLDSMVRVQMTRLLADTNMYFLLDTISQVFPENYSFEDVIVPPMKRLVKHFEGDSLQIPAFRTYGNGFVPEGDSRFVDQIQVFPNYIGLGLHYFLGPDFRYYPAAIPKFISRRFDKDYLPVQLVAEIAEGMVVEVAPTRQPTLLDKMVREGIKLYFMDQLLPNTPDSLKLMYTSQQMEWANTFEPEIYKLLIPELYVTDFVKHRDFLEEKPFTSQLSTSAGNPTAPRLGQYIGWKIVEAYMDRDSEMTLPELCEVQDYEELFKEARYRP